MSGSSSANQPPTYGTKGTAAATNEPGSRWGSVSWTDANGDLWLFGGTGYVDASNVGFLNDLWKYSTSSGQWTWMGGSNAVNQFGTYGTKGVAAAGNQPGARSYSVSWTDATGNLWLFGGFGPNAGFPIGYFNDLWKYSTSTGQWTWMSGSNAVNQSGSFGTKGVAAAANEPAGRMLSVSWTDVNGNLWLFGGEGLGDGAIRGARNDLWKYSTSSGQWTWMDGSSSINEPATYGTKGIPEVGNQPGGRMGSVSWTDATGNLWLFGGGSHGNVRCTCFNGQLTCLG